MTARLRWLAGALAIAVPAAAAAEPAPICADRPAKGNGACTVPAGHWQIETGAADWTGTKSAGERTDLLAIGASLLKLGLSEASDLELGITPYVALTDRLRGARTRSHGFGDVVVRFKQRLTSGDATVQVAVIPFVKLPTAKHDLGNGKAEGGVAAAIGLPVGKLSLSLGPEVDWLADGNGHGRHLVISGSANLAAAVTPRLSVIGEVWASRDFDPAGTVKQVSLDAAAAYAASPTVQLDVGANFGLNRQTPDAEVYAGFAVLF